MSFHLDQKTGNIVFGGWENGIAVSPHKGIGDSKCLNITTVTGEVSVNYARVQQSQVPITAGIFTAQSSTNVAYSGTITLKAGTWITIASSPSSTITNLTTTGGQSSGPNYYVLSAGSGSVQLSISYKGSAISNFGLTGTATFSTINMGEPIAYAYTSANTFPNYQYFVLDSNGLVWENEDVASLDTAINQWSLIQTAKPSNTAVTGIFCFGGYVIVVSDFLWYTSISALGTTWQKMSGDPAPLFQGSEYPHPSVLTPSNLLVLCDGSQLDTLAAVGTFDPTNAATFIWAQPAVELPSTDLANCIALIGGGGSATGGSGGSTTVVVGGLSNYVYPWIPGTSFFQPVIFVSEGFIQNMVTVNNLVYIFAGSKGNIYITNGSSLTSVISVPDYIANNIGANQDPYFIWGGAMYLRGRVWFSVQAPNCGGIWSFVPTINYFPQQDVGTTLRLEHQNSYGTYSGMASIIFAPQRSTDQQAEGVQYFSGWTDGSSGGSANPYGIDFSGTTPYTNGAAILETDIVPLGRYIDPQNYTGIEFKLSAPIVSGETIQILYRTNITSSFQTVGTFNFGNTTGNMSTRYPVPFANAQWIQFQVILVSTATNPSFVRLKELAMYKRL